MIVVCGGSSVCDGDGIRNVLSNGYEGNMDGFLGKGGYEGIEGVCLFSAGFYILYIVVSGVFVYLERRR